MKFRHLLFVVPLILAVAATGYTYFKVASAGADMTVAAQQFVSTLSPEQKQQTVLEYDTPARVDWHFIPKPTRKGLQVKEMNPTQRKAALALLKAATSQVGYDKSVQIMELEAVLHELEKNIKGGNIRDTERYYYTVFGSPSAEGKWGLSVEGHHLSLNFVVDKGQVVASTPQFMGANPAEVKGNYVSSVKKGVRVLAKEELLAFDLVNSLDAVQKEVALTAATAPKEIRAAGEPQPPQTPAVGLSAAKMTKDQTGTLRSLVEEYLAAMPEEVSAPRRTAIDKAGFDKVHFAWEGATEPGIGHYYRVHGPTFLIEFVNVQPDAAGNPANHIHAVWREMTGDFAIPLTK